MVPQGLTNLYLEREKQYKEKVQNGIYLGTQDKPSEVTEPPPPRVNQLYASTGVSVTLQLPHLFLFCGGM